MTDVYLNGGFGESGLAKASDALRTRSARDDATYAAAQLREQRERELLVEQRREAAIAASIREAEDRGEILTRAQRMHGYGRTHAESIAYYSALQDMEDARTQALQRKRLQEWADAPDSDEPAPDAKEAWEGQAAAQKRSVRRLQLREAVAAARARR